MSKKTENEEIKAKLIQAVLKKRLCNAKALKIVESLLEPRNERSDFLDKLKDINPGHYKDIVDERHVQMICGYPLCINVLESVPKQQYRISTAQNKVFDITERKKFCSNNCFKASEYIMAQIPTSPLWLRDAEETPTFKLLDISD